MEEDIENQVIDIANTVANMMREHLAERLWVIPQALEQEDTNVRTQTLYGCLHHARGVASLSTVVVQSNFSPKIGV